LPDRHLARPRRRGRARPHDHPAFERHRTAPRDGSAARRRGLLQIGMGDRRGRRRRDRGRELGGGRPRRLAAVPRARDPDGEAPLPRRARLLLRARGFLAVAGRLARARGRGELPPRLARLARRSPRSAGLRMRSRKTSLWLAVALALAVTLAIWFGAPALWRWFLAMHHIH